MIIINALYIKINSDRSSIYSNKLRTAVMIVMATMKWGRVVHAPAVGFATKSGGSIDLITEESHITVNNQ